MGIWKFVEKLKTKPPKTAREFAGFPIELEWKEVGPEQDDRIMADGRPASAWWVEIEMLRAREPKIRENEAKLMERLQVLRIAEWAFMREGFSGEVLLRIKQLPLVLASDPQRELLEHPERHCSVERRAARPAEKEPSEGQAKP